MIPTSFSFSVLMVVEGLTTNNKANKNKENQIVSNFGTILSFNIYTCSTPTSIAKLVCFSVSARLGILILRLI